MENNAPEGFLLVDEEEYKQLKENLKNIEKVIKSNTARRSEINSDISRIIKETASNAKGSRSSGSYKQEDLIKIIEMKCNDVKNSTFRSKIENVKSSWTTKLKKFVEETHKKQKELKETLKNRFNEGQEQIRKSYSTELINCFQNESNVTNAIPIEHFEYENLIKTYRDAMTNFLLPEMDKMYREHCQKVDQALKEWVRDYTASCVMPAPEVRSSGAVQKKLNDIQSKIDRIYNNERAAVDESVISLETTLEKVKTPLNSFTVAVARRELTVEEKVDEAINNQDYNSALNQALMPTNVDFLLAACRRIPVDDLFSDPVPKQPILLSLLNQMKGNITEDTELKCEFLQETIHAIQPESVVVAQNIVQVIIDLDALINHIDDSVGNVAPSVARRQLKPLRWSADSLKRQITSLHST